MQLTQPPDRIDMESVIRTIFQSLNDLDVDLDTISVQITCLNNFIVTTQPGSNSGIVAHQRNDSEDLGCRILFNLIGRVCQRFELIFGERMKVHCQRAQYTSKSIYLARYLSVPHRPSSPLGSIPTPPRQL
ncbi:Uncharacterised protein [Achromobacter denitrificans]|nr:Uncharacterised protein [Achromobacter denitrificans]